jgi:hypothetical protein
MRAYYSEFAGHCARYYVRHRDPHFKTSIHKKDWTAARDAMGKFTEREQEWLRELYLSGDTMPDNVYQLSKREGLDQDIVWGLLQRYAHAIAKRRGLI